MSEEQKQMSDSILYSGRRSLLQEEAAAVRKKEKDMICNCKHWTFPFSVSSLLALDLGYNFKDFLETD